MARRAKTETLDREVVEPELTGAIVSAGYQKKPASRYRVACVCGAVRSIDKAGTCTCPKCRATCTVG